MSMRMIEVAFIQLHWSWMKIALGARIKTKLPWLLRVAALTKFFLRIKVLQGRLTPWKQFKIIMLIKKGWNFKVLDSIQTMRVWPRSHQKRNLPSSHTTFTSSTLKSWSMLDSDLSFFVKDSLRAPIVLEMNTHLIPMLLINRTTFKIMRWPPAS